jgi:hypothetical protein
MRRLVALMVSIALLTGGGNALAQAQDAPSKTQDSGFPLWVLVVVVLLGALALIAVSAILISRRRSARSLRPPSFVGAPVSAAPPPPSRSEVSSRPAPPTAVSPPPPDPDTADSDPIPAVIVVGMREETAIRYHLEGEMVIGREDADILLPDEQVSRRHALLRECDGHLELTDLGSTNGTEVNGQRITATVTLAHGDTIRAGSTDLLVDLPRSDRQGAPSGETVIKPRAES